MNKNMAGKLSSLPCFEAFGVIFSNIFALYVGGGSHSRVSDAWRFGLASFMFLLLAASSAKATPGTGGVEETYVGAIISGGKGSPTSQQRDWA